MFSYRISELCELVLYYIQVVRKHIFHGEYRKCVFKKALSFLFPIWIWKFFPFLDLQILIWNYSRPGRIGEDDDDDEECEEDVDDDDDDDDGDDDFDAMIMTMMMMLMMMRTIYMLMMMMM